MESRSGSEALGPSPVKNQRLGRGLASLAGYAVPGNPKVLPSEGESKVVPIERVRRSHLNPRKNFDETKKAKEELEELANSIREKGLVQPLVVRPKDEIGGSFYEIVAGERRWRAAQMAGLRQVQVIIRSLSDEEALQLAIIENVQRSDLNAIEEAGGYRDLIESYGYTQEELGQIIGKSRSHLANTMRLLKLPEGVQVLVRDGSLSAGHARALIGHENAEQVAKEIVKKGLNVRDVEALVMGRKAGSAPAPSKPEMSQKDADTRAAERELSDALGLSVLINPTSGEAGEVVVRYKTLEQFDTIHKTLLAKKRA